MAPSPVTGTQMRFSPFKRSRIEQSIPAAFAATVAENADRFAISDGEQKFSYRDLDQRSNQVAHAVLAAVGNSSAPVGILLEQGHATIASTLGVLKAGKMYVALEPADPVRNLQRIVADCRPQLVITNAHHKTLASRIAADTSVVLDIRDSETSTQVQNPQVRISPDSLACIFYTSGSTGVAKGVYDCHRNVLHNVMRYTNGLSICSADRHSLIQSPSFSGTVSTVFCTLLAGGTLCPFDLRARGTGEMIEWVNAEGITIFHSVPAIFDRLLSTRADFPSVRTIRLEGDRAQPHHVRRFQDRFGPHCVLANGLGTTETGLIRQFIVRTRPEFRDSIVPLGYGVDDMQVSVVDESGNEVADGEVGEIHVRSRYLALGYWGKPELTADAFATDPDEVGVRCYKSRDLGRMRPDGSLEYHGRSDTVRKIRGRSIDIAGIEAALCNIASIAEALAVVRDDAQGDRQLVAYLVAPGAEAPDTRSLRHALAKTLDGHAIPSRFLFLDEFPMDRNGKIDRRLLPDPATVSTSPRSPDVATITARQNAIADCFSEVLGIDDVGLHDSFLDLGGDSLKATELLLLFREVLGVDCSPELLAVDDTVVAIDRNLDELEPRKAVVTMQSHGTGIPVFCIHGPRGHVLSYRHLARMLSPGRPVFGIPYNPPDSGEAGEERLEELARRHVQAIKQAPFTGPCILLGECFGGLAAFEVARQLRAQGDPVAAVVLIDTRFPVGLIRQLVVRASRAANWFRTSQGSPRQKLDFFVQRCKGFLSWLKHEFELRRATAEDPAFDEAGAARDDDADSVVYALRQMERRYRARPYAGEVVLYCPGRPHNQLGWKKVSEDAVSIVEITIESTIGYEVHLTEQPVVADLASSLAELFTRFDAAADSPRAVTRDDCRS